MGSVSPGSTVKTVEFKLSLLVRVQGDLLAIGELVRKGRPLVTCRLEVVEDNDHVVALGLATYALQHRVGGPAATACRISTASKTSSQDVALNGCLLVDMRFYFFADHKSYRAIPTYRNVNGRGPFI